MANRGLEMQLPTPETIMVARWYDRVNAKVVRACKRIGEEEGGFDPTESLVTRSYDSDEAVYRWTLTEEDVHEGEKVHSEVIVDLLPYKDGNRTGARVEVYSRSTIHDASSQTDPLTREGPSIDTRFLNINHSRKDTKKALRRLARGIQDARNTVKYSTAPDLARAKRAG